MTGQSADAQDRSRGSTILVVDNYDSFVYNLVQSVGDLVGAERTVDAVGKSDPASTTDSAPERGVDIVVERNDAITLADVDTIDPDAIIVSPGPGTPDDAGISVPLFADRGYPTLGVCLGHQALCAAAGGDVGHAPGVVHGKSSTVTHDGQGIFAGLPDPLSVGRYHSLAVTHDAVPDPLAASARTKDGSDVVMAVRHDSRPHVGVQFHPESILTPAGTELLGAFLRRYADIEVDGSAVHTPDTRHRGPGRTGPRQRER